MFFKFNVLGCGAAVAGEGEDCVLSSSFNFCESFTYLTAEIGLFRGVRVSLPPII